MNPSIVAKAATIAALIKQPVCKSMGLEGAVEHLSAEIVKASGEAGAVRVARLAVVKAGIDAALAALDADEEAVAVPLHEEPAAAPVKAPIVKADDEEAVDVTARHEWSGDINERRRNPPGSFGPKK
jgi:hypothetical protein